MSQANVELIERLYEAFLRRDVGAIMASLAPDIEIEQSAELPWGGNYHGMEGVLSFFGKLTGHIDSKLVFERFLDAGDHVIAIGRTQGTVLATGRAFDVPIAHVWEVRDGRARRFRPYIDNPTMQLALK